MNLIISASTLATPSQISDSGARNFVEIIPVAVENWFRIQNPPEGIPRLTHAQFTGNSGILINRARIDFPGAKGLRPSPAPASFAPCEVYFQIGAALVNIAFNVFEDWQTIGEIIPTSQATPPGVFKCFWDGAAPIGRAQIIYDALNIQPVYYLQNYSATLTLDIDLAGDIIL